MINEKNKKQQSEVGKTRVMSLSTLSTEVENEIKEVQKGKKAKKEMKEVKDEMKDIEKQVGIESLDKQEKTIEEKENSISEQKEATIDEVKQSANIDEISNEDEAIKQEKVHEEKGEEEPSNEIVVEDKVNEACDETNKKEREAEAKKEKECIDVTETNEERLTLEEKRRNERNKLMTIEERRILQKEGKLPLGANEEKKISDVMGKVDYLLIILSILMSWFITYRIYSYFSWGYALFFFLGAHALFTGIFFLSRKKRKIGLIMNIVLSILFLVLSIFMYKVNDFTDQIFDNSESELVMIVANKDARITEKDDFTDKKIAFIKSDGDTNDFAKEMLSEAKKESYEGIVYVTYKEAYEALKSDDVDMMVYTSFTKQRLAEDDIQSWDEVKVVMQKSRALQAVKSKKVDISKDPFNIYISGVDLTSYSINEKGSSDVNIIMTVNPKTEKIIMQTIPRDTWVGLSCANEASSKLTYAGAYGGIDCSINTLEEYLGIEINYYAKINFEGVIDLVDALGGITVNSNVSFCEPHPLDGYGVRNYCYQAGANTLDGVNALMFARIRKVFSDGDIERGRHQMEVVNAVIRKFSESPSLGNINALLGAVENNFTTNLQEDDIGKGFELFMKLKDHLTSIETVSMEGELIWKTDEVTNEYLYYFIPNEGQVDMVIQRIEDVMAGK